MNRKELKIAKAIAQCQGLGFGEDYRPWERITRRRSSSCSNLNLTCIPYFSRLTHFLSRGERQFAFFLLWLGASDVREQFPLWPWPHPQPLSQLNNSAMEPHPGMSDIARDAGIELGREVGASIPAILSKDFMVTVPDPIRRHRLVGVTCKPQKLFDDAQPCDRIRERIELDRRYCVAANIPHRLAHPELLPEKFRVQLHWLAPIETKAELDVLTRSRAYQHFVTELKTTAYTKPAYAASREAGARVGWARVEEQRALRVAIWYQHLDVDVCKSIDMTRPLLPGGVAWRRAMQLHWLDATA